MLECARFAAGRTGPARRNRASRPVRTVAAFSCLGTMHDAGAVRHTGRCHATSVAFIGKFCVTSNGRVTALWLEVSPTIYTSPLQGTVRGLPVKVPVRVLTG